MLGSKPINSFDIPDLDRQIKDIKNSINELNVFFGRGSPEGVKRSKLGAIYINLNGGASTTLYIKESGNELSTGWVAK